MKRRGMFPLTLTIVTLLIPDGLMPQSAAFEEANQAYLAGDFHAALDSYRQILEDGYESPSLYYNLGNTYFKLGQLGFAVLNYERALKMRPGNDDARANLELARSLITDDITPLPRFWPLRVWDWWFGVISGGWLPIATAVVYALTVCFLTFALLARQLPSRRLGRRLTLWASVLLVGLSLNLAARWLRLGIPTEAVVVSDEVLVQSAPSDDRTLQVFTIHSGTKVRIDQLSGDWAEIVLEDGKVGWVKREVFEII